MVQKDQAALIAVFLSLSLICNVSIFSGPNTSYSLCHDANRTQAQTPYTHLLQHYARGLSSTNYLYYVGVPHYGRLPS